MMDGLSAETAEPQIGLTMPTGSEMLWKRRVSNPAFQGENPK